MFQILSRFSKKVSNYEETKQPGVLLLSKEQHLFHLLQKHLTALPNALSLSISSDLSDLEPITQSLNQCEVIIVDGSLGRCALDVIKRALKVMPDYSIIVGVYTNESSKRGFCEWPSLCYLSSLLDVSQGWDEPWESIMKLHNAWHSPILMSRIEDISVSDVLQMIAIGQWTSQVGIKGNTAFHREGETDIQKFIRGCITFNQGMPTNAWSSENLGVRAINDLLSLVGGELIMVRPSEMPTDRNVNSTIQEIIFHYAVIQDEIVEDRNEDQKEEYYLDCFPLNVKNNSAISYNKAALDSRDHICSSKFSEDSVDISIISLAQQANIDIWWSKLSEYKVGEVLSGPLKNSFPLRWMTLRELQLLSRNKKQFHAIIVRGNRNFIETVVSGYGRNFDFSRFEEDKIPVIRIGRYVGSILYFVCMTHEINTEFLAGHPCVIWLDNDDSEEEIKRARHPVLIVFSTDSERVNRIIMAITSKATNVYAVLETKDQTWRNISAGFKEIIELLSKVSTGVD